MGVAWHAHDGGENLSSRPGRVSRKQEVGKEEHV